MVGVVKLMQGSDDGGPLNLKNLEKYGMRLQDKVAIITGAGRGIGRAIALAYAGEGARLALAARTRSELEETARQAQALGAESCVIPTDVMEQSQVDGMVRQTLDRFDTIDIYPRGEL